MKRDRKSMDDVLRAHLPWPEEEITESNCARVLESLRSRIDFVQEDHRTDPVLMPRFRRRRTMLLTAVAGVFLAVVIGAIVAQRTHGTLAHVESIDGSLYQLVEGNVHALDIGQTIRAGETIRSNGGAGGTVLLADGSRIEMRSKSEVVLARASDGIRIRLNEGSVIVNAAKQGQGHLYVQTKDVTVSVVGTVFLVNAEEAGSRVAVIEGAVRVQQGVELKTLLPGEQLATAPSSEMPLLGGGISWSREALAHLTLLQQSAAGAAAVLPEFEVASVRPNQSGSTASRMEHQQDRVTISNATLEQIIRYAYNDHRVKMSGPSLLNSGRYDILAKASPGTPDIDLLAMLQTLLMDRFKMKLHRETIEMPVYALTVAKNGHKLKEIKPGESISGAGAGTASRTDGLSSMTTMGELPFFAAALSRRLDRPVIDKTSLEGRYSIFVTYLPDRLLGADGVSGPSIFTALEDQLGLRLESERSRVEIMVIDNIQEPSPN